MKIATTVYEMPLLQCFDTAYLVTGRPSGL